MVLHYLVGRFFSRGARSSASGHKCVSVLGERMGMGSDLGERMTHPLTLVRSLTYTLALTLTDAFTHTV